MKMRQTIVDIFGDVKNTIALYWHWQKDLREEDIRAIRQLKTASNMRRLLIFAILILLVQGSNLVVEIFFSQRVQTRSACIAVSIIMAFITLFYLCRYPFVVKGREMRFLHSFWLCFIAGTFCFGMLDVQEFGILENFYFIPFTLALIPLLESREMLAYLGLSTGLQLIYLMEQGCSVTLLQKTILAALIAFVLGQLMFASYILAKTAQFKLEMTSQTDFSTGLYNRRGLFERMAVFIQAKDDEASLALAILDIDYFKKYNDEFGHLQGDICLKRIADDLLAFFDPKTSVVARFGGEELVIVLPNVSNEEARAQLLACKRRIEALALPSGYPEKFPYVTVSIGYAIGVYEAKDFDRFFKQADNALYLAKNNGRNLLCGPEGFCIR